MRDALVRSFSVLAVWPVLVIAVRVDAALRHLMEAGPTDNARILAALGAAVAAGAVVIRDVPANAVVMGAPARPRTALASAIEALR